MSGIVDRLSALRYLGTMDDRCAFRSLPRLLSGVLLFWLAACASSSPYTYDPAPEPDWRTADDGGDDRHAIRTSSWARMPLSWGKLGAIESWMKSPEGRRSQHWSLEGELALSEGRVEFARRDLVDGGAPQALEKRLWASKQGFRRVRSDARATAAQRERAGHGIKLVDELLNGTVTRRSQASGVGVIARTAWKASRPRPRDMTPSGNDFSRITIHHSAEASPQHLDGSLASSAAAIRKIQHVHMNGATTGYGDIGYHFLIDPQGRVFRGRELDYQGAHAYGVNNKRNIGICVLGNFERSMPSRKALAALEKTIGDLRKKHGISRTQVFGHKHFRNTACPGKQLGLWVERYAGRRR